VAVGRDVTRVQPGDRVMAAVFPRWLDGPFRAEVSAQLGGSFDGMLTEYAALDQDALVPIPEHLSYEQAATRSLLEYRALRHTQDPLATLLEQLRARGAVAVLVDGRARGTGW
jgi:NADPH:quinone reductase-like Zn-dependent oxidoreductase